MFAGREDGVFAGGSVMVVGIAERASPFPTQEIGSAALHDFNPSEIQKCRDLGRGGILPPEAASPRITPPNTRLGYNEIQPTPFTNLAEFYSL
jgi:hypothetical protein